MSPEHSCQLSVFSSTQASSAPGSDTASASEIMSTTSRLTADLQNISPAYRYTLRSLQNLGTEIARLQAENKRLVEHNNAIEKDMESLNEHNTNIKEELEASKELNAVMEKELATLKEENIKISEAKGEAMKKLAKAEEEKAGLQKELDGFDELKEIRGVKRRCEELEDRANESQKRIQKLFKDYQQQTEKCIADVQHQSQQNFEQEIGRIKADHAQAIQGVMSAVRFMYPVDWRNGYISREKPFDSIPHGLIQVSLGEVEWLEDSKSYNLPCEDKNTRFLYVVRDLFTDFQKFTNLLELIFRLKTNPIVFLMGKKSGLMSYRNEKAKVIKKWEREASQKDRLYITQYSIPNSGALYYIED